MSDYLGRFTKGGIVPLSLVTVNAAGTPSLPDAAPSAIVYSDSATIKQIKLPIVDRYVITAFFRYPVLLDGNFSAGRHRAEFNYAIGGTSFLKTAEFEVLSSGQGDGCGIALTSLDLPGRAFAIMQGMSGRIKKFGNPRAL